MNTNQAITILTGLQRQQFTIFDHEEYLALGMAIAVLRQLSPKQRQLIDAVYAEPGKPGS